MLVGAACTATTLNGRRGPALPALPACPACWRHHAVPPPPSPATCRKLQQLMVPYSGEDLQWYPVTPKMNVASFQVRGGPCRCGRSASFAGWVDMRVDLQVEMAGQPPLQCALPAPLPALPAPPAYIPCSPAAGPRVLQGGQETKHRLFLPIQAAQRCRRGHRGCRQRRGGGGSGGSGGQPDRRQPAARAQARAWGGAGGQPGCEAGGCGCSGGVECRPKPAAQPNRDGRHGGSGDDAQQRAEAEAAAEWEQGLGRLGIEEG